MTELKLCESCAPEGLSAEEYATRPLVSKCFACGTEATRWYVSAERVLKALLKERKALGMVEGYCCCPKRGMRHLRTAQCDT